MIRNLDDVGAKMTIENYIKTYNGIIQRVRKETYEKYQHEAEMLFEFIDNWVDLVPRDKETFLQATISLSGIILFNSWKLTNWISFQYIRICYMSWLFSFEKAHQVFSKHQILSS